MNNQLMSNPRYGVIEFTHSQLMSALIGVTIGQHRNYALSKTDDQSAFVIVKIPDAKYFNEDTVDFFMESSRESGDQALLMLNDFADFALNDLRASYEPEILKAITIEPTERQFESLLSTFEFFKP